MLNFSVNKSANFNYGYGNYLPIKKNKDLRTKQITDNDYRNYSKIITVKNNPFISFGTHNKTIKSNHPILDKLIAEGFIPGCSQIFEDKNQDIIREIETKLQNDKLRKLFKIGASYRRNVLGEYFEKIKIDSQTALEHYVRAALSPAIKAEMLKLGIPDDVQKKFSDEQLSNFIKQLNDKSYKIEYLDLFDGAVLLTAAKTKMKKGIKIIDTITMPSDGIISSAVTKQAGAVSKSHNKNSNRHIEIQYSMTTNNQHVYKYNIVNQIETISDKSGKPEYIIHTKSSNILNGAYEITKYKLSDFQNETDLVKKIKEGTVKGGEKISEITKNGGTITLSQNFENDGSKIIRRYEQTLSEDGGIVSSKYYYQIKDKDGNSILNLDRKHQKLSNNFSITSVNGKKYSAEFDDKNMIIKISQGGNISNINIKDKLKRYKYSDISEQDAYKKFFESCKLTPIDQLLILQDIPYINMTSRGVESIDNDKTTLNISDDMPALCHELGHIIDIGTTVKKGQKIFENKELLNIYNEEFKNFNKKYPPIMQDILEYLSRNHNAGAGGIKTGGIQEFIAETNLLMSTPLPLEGCTARNLYLTQYFPKTIAKIAELLGYTAE